jgi:putative ABC transport system ATP-binding protein
MSGVVVFVIDLVVTLTHRQGTATVLVTHDRAHMTAVDQVVAVLDGRVEERVAARA